MHVLRRGVLQPLSRAQLERLYKVAPSKDERKILAEYRGDVSELATVEQYFVALGKVPRIRRRLRLLLLREEAPGLASYDSLALHASGLLASPRGFATVQRRARPIALRSQCSQGAAGQQAAGNRDAGSPSLRVGRRSSLRRLQIVLSTGNWLNGGTPQGRAHGFALEFLSKVPGFSMHQQLVLTLRVAQLAMTKSRSGGSLVHWIAKQAQKKGVASLPAELANVHAAANSTT